MPEENKTDLSVSMADANLYTILVTLPIILPFIIAFSGCWGFDVLINGFGIISKKVVIFLLLVILGVFVHEYLHKIAWAFFGKKPLSAIVFGFQMRTLSPYAHCTEPMDINGYRWGAFIPGFMLGILPAIIAIIIGNSPLLLYGILFIFTAGGDFLILWLTRFLQTGVQVEDHPTRAGCYIIERT